MNKKSEQITDTEQLHRVERYSGVMRRIIPLPNNVLENEISASFSDGVLHIDIPKMPGIKEQAQSVKQIEIK